MGYMMDTALKMSFREYKNFEEFVRSYVKKINNSYVHVSIIESDEIIDYLFDCEYMDIDCMCITAYCKYGSLAHDILTEYRDSVIDEEREEEYSYMEIGESIYEYQEWYGMMDDGPYMDCTVNPNLSGRERVTNGKLKIIID